jgi:glycosyltransferase involved in cell wall biosynthesis
MNKIPVSVLIITKNAGSHISECVESLGDFEQVIVVDSASTDETCNLAARHGVEIVNFTWNGTYPKKRQWCLDMLHLKHDWVLFVDADERVMPCLVREIRQIFRRKEPPVEAGFFITGQYAWGKKILSFGTRNRKIALLHRRRMMFPVVDDLDCPGMGEIEGHYQPVLKDGYQGKIGWLKHMMLHHTCTDYQEWLARHRRYAAWEICMNGKKVWPRDPIASRELLKKLLRSLVLRPELIFLHSYILKLGFLDGVAGFHFAKSRWRYYHMIRSGQSLTSIE